MCKLANKPPSNLGRQGLVCMYIHVQFHCLRSFSTSVYTACTCNVYILSIRVLKLLRWVYKCFYESCIQNKIKLRKLHVKCILCVSFACIVIPHVPPYLMFFLCAPHLIVHVLLRTLCVYTCTCTYIVHVSLEVPKQLYSYNATCSNQFVLLHTVHTCILWNFLTSCSAQPGQHSHMQASAVHCNYYMYRCMHAHTCTCKSCIHVVRHTYTCTCTCI